MARQACKMTQVQVGRHFGISKQSIAQWESDATAPEIERIPELARMFNVSCHYLLTANHEPDDLERLMARLEKLQGADRKAASLLFPQSEEGQSDRDQAKRGFVGGRNVGRAVGRN